MIYVNLKYSVSLIVLSVHLINSISVKSLCQEAGNSIKLINNSPIILKAFVSPVIDTYGLIPINHTGDALMLNPITIFKGDHLIKQFNIVSGQHENRNLIGSIRGLHDCYKKHKISDQFENFINDLPTNLIVFGTISPVLKHNRHLLRVHGIHQSTRKMENSIWHTLGWGEWSDYASCSVTCGNGIQQRYRKCMKNLHHKLYGNLHQQRQQQHTKDQTTLVQHQNVPPTSLHHRSKHWDTVKLHQHDKMRKIAKRRLHRTISHFTFKSDECQGYNVEQRKCNMFDCNDACDMLNRPRKHYQNMAMNEPNAIVNSLGTQNHVNSLYECNENFLNRLNGTNKFNFTLMARVRLKHFKDQTLFSIRGQNHNVYLELTPVGLKLVQEMRLASDVFPINVDLYNNQWHQIAISVDRGIYLNIYIDCRWDASYVITSESISLPDNNADIEIGRNFLTGELDQMQLIIGSAETKQCSSSTVTITESKIQIVDNLIN